MAQNDPPGSNPLTSLLRRLFGGAPPVAPTAQTPSVPTLAPEIVITDENRADLLLLAQNAPLAYGYWAQVKRLYKAAEKAGDTDLLHTLISRLDVVGFTDKPEMLSTPYREANSDTVIRVRVVGTTAYALTQGSQSALNIVDISDPVRPRLMGKWSVPQPVDVVVADNRAYVLEASTYQKPGALHVLDVSQPDNPRALGKTELKAAVRVALMGRYALVITNDYRNSTLHVFDTANPQSILTVGTAKVDTPGDIAVWHTTAYVLSKTNSYGAQKIVAFDLSNPTKPTETASSDASNANALAISGDYLYVTASSYNYSRSQTKPGLYVYPVNAPPIALRARHGFIEIEDAVRVAVQGRYAYVGLWSNYGGGRGGFQGGFQIVDVADPMQPKPAGKLSSETVSHLAIDAAHPDRLVLCMATERYTPACLCVADVSHPDKPFLFGTLPSNDTFGYMKRRARRALRTLAVQDPARYVTLAAQVLTTTGRGLDTIDARVQWVSMNILFGNSRRWEQSSHGRGAYLQRGSRLSVRTREEAYPHLWDRHPLLAESLYTLAELPWQTHETACKMLRGMKRPLPDAPDATLLRFLQSPSPLLIAVATRTLAAKLETDRQIAPDLAAETFFKGSGRSRRAVREYVARQTAANTLNSQWTNPFANRLYKLASENVADAELSRRQGIAFAYLVATFPGVLSRQIAPELAARLYATRRPELREWMLTTLRNTSVTQIGAWFRVLAPLTDDLRMPAVAALTGSLRDKPLAYDTMKALVNDPSEWIRATIWDMIAASPTPDADLARLWDDLLAATTETDALRTATASASAIALFNRLSLDGSKLQSLLESRPFLVGLLPQSALQNIVRVLPVASILGLVRAATEAQWSTLRAIITAGLNAANAVPAFWQMAWQQIGATGDTLLVTRLLNDEVMSATFLQVNDPEYLDTSNPIFGPLLGRWVRAHNALFTADSMPLLQIATHTLPDIRAFGLERVRQVGMGLPFALRLLESELTAPVEMGKTFFETVPAGDPREIEAVTALCDSPKSSVRAWGRQVLETRWNHLPHEELFNRLSENTDPAMEAFLAGKILKTDVAFTLAPVFDRQVLRSRDKGRKAKELVKQRLNAEPSHDVSLLLEVARSRSQRDAEWALGQLARLALEGVEVEGLEVTS